MNKHHKPVGAVYIGRGSLWGNPLPIDANNDRESVIRQYEDYLLSRPDLLARVKSLHGKKLMCFCAPAPCHGDVLAHYADAVALTGYLPAVRACDVIFGPETSHADP